MAKLPNECTGEEVRVIIAWTFPTALPFTLEAKLPPFSSQTQQTRGLRRYLHTCEPLQLPLGVSQQLGGLVPETLRPLLSTHDGSGLRADALLDLVVLICQLPIQDLTIDMGHSFANRLWDSERCVQAGAEAYLLGFVGLVSSRGCRFLSSRCCHAVVGTLGLQATDLSAQRFQVDYGSVEVLLTL